MRRALGLVAALASSVAARAHAQPTEVEIRGETAADETQATTQVGRAELSSPGRSTADVLARTPSVAIARTGGAFDLATATLRGATSAETPVYFGHVLLNDDLTGTADLSTMPPWLLAGITVHRGHAPLALDRGGLAGAIVLEPFVASGTHAGLDVMAGSFGTRRVGAHASVGDARGGAAIAADLSSTRGNFRYLDDRGTRFDPSDDRMVERQNGDARALDLWSTARLDLGGRGTLDLLVRGYAREQGVPGLGVLPARDARAQVRSLLSALSGAVDCDRSCRVAVSLFARTSKYELSDPNGELLFTAARQHTESSSTGARVALELAPMRWLRVETGASSSIGLVAVDPAGPAESHARRLSVRLFAGLALSPIDQLSLRAEAAVASEALATADSRASQPAPTARLGAVVRPIDELSFFASAGRYARVPTLGEQFGVGATVLGNPELRPESGLSLDLGSRLHLVRDHVELRAELVGFARGASDRIAYQRSSFGALRPYNLASARVLGLEAIAELSLFDLVDAGVSLTLSDPRDTSDTRTTSHDVLPYEAQLVAAPSLGVSAREVVRELGWDTAALTASLLYRAPRSADPAGLIALPSQVSLDLEARVGLFTRRLELALRVANLLDDRSTDLVGYPLPGRAAYASLASRWN